MAPIAMGMAMVKPSPLKAPRDAQTEGGGAFCFIFLVPSLFSLTFYLSDYSTWNEIIATMVLLGLEVLLSTLAFSCYSSAISMYDFASLTFSYHDHGATKEITAWYGIDIFYTLGNQVLECWRLGFWPIDWTNGFHFMAEQASIFRNEHSMFQDMLNVW